jgi:hypothetical protein
MRTDVAGFGADLLFGGKGAGLLRRQGRRQGGE